jgi:uncharacterized membrane protein HdeD (DUF308 family)
MFKEMTSLGKEMLASHSRTYIIVGIILTIVGIYFLSHPTAPILTRISLLGIYFVIKGVLDFFSIFHSGTKRKGWTVAGAIFGIIAGIIILAYPMLASLVTVTFFTWIAALGLIVYGAVALGESVIFGLLSIITGLLLFFVPPMATATAIGWIIGFLVLILGISSISIGAGFNLESKKQ